MAFDLETFEAEIALKLLPTEQLPSVAHALEAGFDGPHVLRMAILEPTAGWAIDQALQLMMDEIGCHSISVEQAAMFLARKRAEQLLQKGEDPVASVPFFHRLYVASDYPCELSELAYFDDDDIFTLTIPNRKRLGHVKHCFSRNYVQADLL